MLPPIATVFGVDFSGAKLAGDNLFLAEVRLRPSQLPLLHSVGPLSALAGTAERAPVLAKLVELISQSSSALWGMDFPFALPIELSPPGTTFDDQLHAVATFTGNAQQFGRDCVARCQVALGRMHVRRTTDSETKTPFDCYHYRIIHQTFHGMRDVLLPLRSDPSTAILPFDPPDALSQARRLVAEACPSSTLKRWALPHTLYKQPAGGPLAPKRRATRKILFAGLRQHIDIPEDLQRLISRNPGGDAADAVIAALGALHSLSHYNPTSIAAHPRYPREGMVFH